MDKIVLFEDRIKEFSNTDEIFCGYIKGKPLIEGGNVRHSGSHSQPYRIYSSNGIWPTISTGGITRIQKIFINEDN